MFNFYFKKILIKIFGVLLKPFKFKGFYLLIKHVNFYSKKKLAITRLPESKLKFAFYINDPYWSLGLSKNYLYEKEIYSYKNYLINNLSSNSKMKFLDLGSNIGYWSLEFSKVLDQKNIIAVEPNPEVNKIHILNQYLNNLNYSIIEKCLWNTNQEILKLNIDTKTQSSVGSFTSKKNISNKILEVESITIPSIINDYPSDYNWIVKMDIEGSEIHALEFIKNYERNNINIIYEDHGKDINSSVSKLLIESNFKVFYSGKNGIFQTDINDIKKIKKNSSKGYNFLAIRF